MQGTPKHTSHTNSSFKLKIIKQELKTRQKCGFYANGGMKELLKLKKKITILAGCKVTVYGKNVVANIQ